MRLTLECCRPRGQLVLAAAASVGLLTAAPAGAVEAAAAQPLARMACYAELTAKGALAESGEALQTAGACGIADPVRLTGLDLGAHRLTLSAGPVLSCDFALALTGWLADVVGPLAWYHLRAVPTELRTGPGYACRNRNHQAEAPLSEHAFGRALDIIGVTLADGTKINFVDGGGAYPGAGQFLAAMRQAACGVFSTVLGPGADAEHADHLHVDLAERAQAQSMHLCQ